jgi:hypothetical protein
MKITPCVVLAAAALLAPATASAQGGGAQQPMTIGIAAGVQRAWNGVKMNALESAKNMPEEHYAHEAGPGARNFGELFGHIANAQFNNCAVAKGEANPNDGKDQETLNKTKAEYVAALQASFDYCDPVYASLTDASAVEMIKQGNNTVARGYVLFNNVSHTNEMYGTSAAYYRMKGLVPPSTERQQRSRR